MTDQIPTVRITRAASVNGREHIVVTHQVGVWENRSDPIPVDVHVPALADRFFLDATNRGEESHLRMWLGGVLWHEQLRTLLRPGHVLRLRLAVDHDVAERWPWEAAESEEFDLLQVVRAPKETRPDLRFESEPREPSMRYVFNSPKANLIWTNPNQPASGRQSLIKLGDESEIVERLAGYRVLASPGAVLGEAEIPGLLEGVEVLHITCHGVRSGSEVRLAMFDPAEGDGHVYDISGSQLFAGIHAAIKNGTDLRLVTIAACWSGASGSDSRFLPMAESVSNAGVPVVIAMTRPVHDVSGRNILRTLYPALLEGDLLDALEAVRPRLKAEDGFTMKVYAASYSGHLFGASVPDIPLLVTSPLHPVLRTSTVDKVIDRIDGTIPDWHEDHQVAEPPGALAFVSPSARIVGRQLDGRGPLELGWLDRVGGAGKAWTAVDVDGARVLAISDALSPGAACVRAITSDAGGGTLGWTFDVGGASSAVLSPETSEHAVALGSGHIVITSSGQVISKGSAVINRIGQLLASVADQVTRLEADGWGDAVAVLAVLKSDEVRLFTARGSQPMGSGTDATFVRSASGAADELRIRGIAGTVESRAIARSAGGA